MSEVVRIIVVKKKFIIIFFTSVVSFGVGFYLGDTFKQGKIISFTSSFRTVRENNDSYEYISPLIGTVSAPATDVGVYSDLQEEVQAYITKEKRNKDLYDISFYFRDLTSPLWFGINEEVSFFPASLFKLPIAIAAYKQEEKEPGFLNKRLMYTKDIHDLSSGLPDSAQSTLTIGATYTASDLISIMIEKSDNGAKNLLFSSIKKEYLSNLFRVVTGKDPFAGDNYDISPRTYAHFLRILYNSSFINEEHSEYLLSLLTKTTFKEGIVAGVPNTIGVANKFGIYEIQDIVNGEVKVLTALHDCGIIYHIGHPYIICIMTKGKDQKTLSNVLSNISQIIYKYQTHHDVGDAKIH